MAIRTTEARNTGGAESPHLRRELHLWEAVGISLSLVAPSMAANINPQETAGSVGRAVPLALATIGVLLIAWTFVRLTQRFDHAGSVYGFVGAEFLDALGICILQPGWAPFAVGAIALAGVWALAASNIRGGTRVLLVIRARRSRSSSWSA